MDTYPLSFSSVCPWTRAYDFTCTWVCNMLQIVWQAWWQV